MEDGIGSKGHGGGRRVTLADVAARAKTSTITVSRALRRPEMVSQALRDRILEAVEALGYVPDPAARALANRRSSVIGIVIPSITNNVFVDVLSGIHDALDPLPFDLQIGNARYDADREEDLVRVFLSQRPAGLIVSGIDQTAATRSMLERSGVPVVQIMDLGPDPIDMMVGFSHRDAAEAGARHLLEAGYRFPAFIGARMDPRSHRRLDGFRSALRKAGRDADIRVVTTPTPSSVALGRTLVARLLDQAPETDAILCNNDDLALGAQFEALSRGIAIPDRLGICGFNDLEVMEAAHPSITSVRTFRYAMGRIAVEMLAARLSGRPVEPCTRDLGFELRRRTSTRTGRGG